MAKIKKYKPTELKEFYKELFIYKGRHIGDSEHSIERFEQRFPDEDISKWKEIVEKGIDIILDVFKDSEGKYILVNKKTDIAIQFDWRKDKYRNDGKNHGFSATTLSFTDHQRVLKMDTKLFIEKIKREKLEESFVSAKYKNMIKEKNFYMSINLLECDDYKIYIHKGQVRRNFNVIEVKC